jgi:hypothetical protein
VELKFFHPSCALELVGEKSMGVQLVNNASAGLESLSFSIPPEDCNDKSE